MGNPPDLAGRRRAIAPELFEAGVLCVRAVLEALDPLRPNFETLPEPEGEGVMLTTRFYCQGVPVVVPLSLSLPS